MSLPMTLQQLATQLNGAIQVADINVTGTAIDSRKVKKGDLFIALAGEQVDGHDYLASAREAGAVAALVSRQVEDPLPQLCVADVRLAYQQLAKIWRQQSQATIIGVTGSNGKTTVKEMIHAILSQRHHVIATQGNFNNDLGVPLTLTRLKAEHQYAVVEMGINHPGEMTLLAEIAQPDIAVINNIAAAHLEGFGTLEGIAKAKGEIFVGLSKSGTAVINAGMPYQTIWKSQIGTRDQITFGLHDEAEITALDCQSTPAGSHFMVRLDDVCHFVSLPLPGPHNICNALAAIAVCQTLDVAAEDMLKGLASMKPVPHRLQIRTAATQAILIDDTYNANPGSFTEALQTLKHFSGARWLVLGDFAELGEGSEQIHQQMGEDARLAGIEKLFTVGSQSVLAAKQFGKGSQHFENIEALQEALQRQLAAGVTCLIKGSRFMQLDKLADLLVSGGGR
ncbi:UDP-N-acetylmuramoylalanyl-D-glutamyl-2,6- diaminopimelate--D-alanyl-D-alanine ligase [Methylophaga frappieri]|uniref:UDP-N-acetylmuramoyl-tripeptide--D-alanyl-D-alanine ligase n=1 Tax=Methylophaga frappieri (strain ATCC BAA-2434 / DSM 25690 / JAM7) TaxID=754477 RepID=I1YGJ9_METFJ|nr:UDP-N-acetylmuramoyl-tripeptide--D-alanyl-D-alanine ligase [Methylophaga frappieri]AFJ02042.1 UDP-N-acetylmuramoylalanyl-D-glutamyl-2,6- diaminopimelate--D-alanyl-D-alanine ligase [Methylophaga frappieri]